MDLPIDNKFRIVEKSGSSTSGEIFSGQNIETDESVTIKLEPVRMRHPRLESEASLLNGFLNCDGAAIGIPKVFWNGAAGDYNVMVNDHLGPSLDRFEVVGPKFSLKTTLMLADQMISRIEFLHSKNLLHRDIKPGNFCMGTGKRDGDVYICNFGLAKLYRDPKTHKHIPYVESRVPAGGVSYRSINSDFGIEPSRRDDLEALGHTLVCFLRGSLPWLVPMEESEEKKKWHDRVNQLKITTSVDSLCEGLPSEFATYIKYCRALGFEDKPDYDYLKKLFRDLFAREGYEMDHKFDWTLNKAGKEAAVEKKTEDGTGAAATAEKSVEEEIAKKKTTEEEVVA